MVCDVAHDLIVEEQERLSLARFTGQCVAQALGGDVVPTLVDASALVGEWLAADLSADGEGPVPVSEADEWMGVMFARPDGGAS